MNDIQPSGGGQLTTGSFADKLRALTGKEITSRAEPHQSHLGSALYLLLDCSASMSGDKISQARKGALDFAHEAVRKGFRAGLICFASEAEVGLAVGTNMVDLAAALKRAEAGGTTNLEAGLRLGLTQLQAARGIGSKLLFVVTDGAPDDQTAALKVRDEAVRHSIEIMALGTEDADQSFLDRLATKKNLSVAVSSHQLGSGISQMAKLLGPPGT